MNAKYTNGSCSVDPKTNSETKNPEFFTNFPTHIVYVIFDEKITIKYM